MTHPWVPEPDDEHDGLLDACEALLKLAEDDGRSKIPFPKYVNDPLGFYRDVLGVEPWDRMPGMDPAQSSQVEILEAVRDHDKVAVRSGHKVSKSCSAAGLALWWVNTRLDARVTLTAPAAHQVETILWPEVRLLHSGQHPGRRKGHVMPKLPGEMHIDCRTGLVLGDGWGIKGLTTDTPERMSGKSGSKQLFIVDEASGYPEDIFVSIFGNLAGGGKVVLFFNPTRTSGTAYDVFHDKGAGWKTAWIPSYGTPNFHGGRVDGLANPEWEAWARKQWGGPGNPLYDVRVAGQFPSQGTNAVIGLGLVEAGTARWSPEVAEAAEGELDIGVDVSREGDDDSVLTAVRGLVCVEQELVQLDRHMDAVPLGNQVGEAAARMARRLARRSDRFRPRIKIDCIGVGSAVVDYLLTNCRDEFDVIAVNVGSSADKSLILVPAEDGRPAVTAAMMYRNLRSQLWFGCADWLKRGGCIPANDRLHGELVAPTFGYIERGKLAVQEKKELKKTLKRSPDHADSLNLAIYDPPDAGGAEVGAHLLG